jgi:HCOMODA/2-hydroxy-3-carboxy-muconic semialdehyde decarboxylase
MHRSADDALAAIKRELAIAGRVLVRQGVLDAFGHVSARDPLQPDRFLMPRRRPPALVEPDDILAFDFDGSPIEAEGPPVFLERFIHAAIYAARPDAMAVIHSHSPRAVAFSVTSAPLRAVCHTCGFLGEGAPTFEIRDVAGDASDLLIRDLALGRALAEVLGPHALVLMRGHGSTCVGASIPHAVYRAVYAEINARIQLDAARLGQITYLTEAEAATAEATAPLQVERCWDLWCAEAGSTKQEGI